MWIVITLVYSCDFLRNVYPCLIKNWYSDIYFTFEIYLFLAIFQQPWFKVVSRVEKTEFFKKGWKFANHTWKTFFCCDGGKKQLLFFLLFSWDYFLQHWAIWLHIQFKFCLNIYLFLNINTNQTMEQNPNCIRSSHLFHEQLLKEVLKVKCQACTLLKNELKTNS